jgi:hypothetical protein
MVISIGILVAVSDQETAIPCGCNILLICRPFICIVDNNATAEGGSIRIEDAILDLGIWLVQPCDDNPSVSQHGCAG